jgi:hypothetical protein
MAKKSNDDSHGEPFKPFELFELIYCPVDSLDPGRLAVPLFLFCTDVSHDGNKIDHKIYNRVRLFLLMILNPSNHRMLITPAARLNSKSEACRVLKRKSVFRKGT